MLPECPDDLKYILPYLQRASELKVRDPIAAYYCGFYAANLAIQKGYPKNQANEAYLMALLDDLGAQKEALKNEPTMQDNSAAKTHMIQMALKIFLTADNEDRSGQASKKTAYMFHVASQFIEVLRVFGEIAEELEERARYAKWKAADISKALNEGRQPVPGPPGSNAPAASPALSPPKPAEETHADRNLPSMSGTYDPPKSACPPAAPPAHSSPPPVYPAFRPVSPPQHYQPPPPPAVAAAPRQTSPPYSPSAQASYDLAEKHCRYARSAIQFEDAPTAIREMEQAIAILRDLQK